jgi:hypothetical protein
MFCGERWSPQKSGGQWLPSEDAEASQVCGRLSLFGVDRGAWRVLLQMVHCVHQTGPPLAAVHLRAEGAAGAALHLHDICACSFPGQTGLLPFRIQAPSISDTRDPVIRITFARSLSDEEFNHPIEALRVWGRLVAAGGYLNSWEPSAQAKMVMGEVYPLTCNTVEATAVGFASGPQAFNGLVNLTARLHVAFRPIVSLEIRG